MNLSLCSAFEERNQVLAPQLLARLALFCAEPAQHARFLNMLSLLEHIGSRKIMTSPATAQAGQDHLRHLAEETRHAFFFKRAAEKIARTPLDYSAANTMAGAAARFYMGRLDAEIAHALGKSPPALPYLYMSLIVELRAVWTYRLYQSVLAAGHCGFTLNSVLAEEELHLAAMLARLMAIDDEAAQHIALFCGFEEARFARLWSAIQDENTRACRAAE